MVKFFDQRTVLEPEQEEVVVQVCCPICVGDTMRCIGPYTLDKRGGNGPPTVDGTSYVPCRGRERKVRVTAYRCYRCRAVKLITTDSSSHQHQAA